MSADAKAWPDGEAGWYWKGTHDGPCEVEHGGTLTELLVSLEECAGGHEMSWGIRAYPNGTFGLVGYRA